VPEANIPAGTRETVSTARPAVALASGLAVTGLISVISVIAALAMMAGSARAAASTKTVSYHGYSLTVPAGWPVFLLARDRTACVRFDRHAVYLGRPGAEQSCPAAAAGRTEAILVQPGHQATGELPLPSRTGAAPARGSSAQVVNAAHGVVVTATWGRQPAVVARALGLRRLTEGWAVKLPPAPKAIAAASGRMRTAAAKASGGARGQTGGARAQAASTASGPGAIYTGPGFDACSTPSSSQMSAWSASPYRALGVYIGGANMACSQPNLTAAWVGAESAAGWRLVPIYVGLQAPSNSCGCAAISASAAASQGAAAAQDAVAHAQAIGLGAGNPIYDDMESYNRGSNTNTVLAFLSAWTTQLHADGYASGIYSSADSGVEDLVAQAGTGYPEPDDIWIARWNNAQNTSDPNVPSSDWPSHQRLHQYDGAHNETYGGATINIDGDYLDAATAGTGSVTPAVAVAPSLSVLAAADGAIDLRPSWSGATGVSSWQVLAGSAPTALRPVGAPVSAGAPMPIVMASSDPYFAVQALDASGQVLGTSTPVATPAHVAIFGRSAFVPRRGLTGIPVGCFRAAPCRVTTAITAGRTKVATTGPEGVAAGGGLAYFSLSPAARSKLAHAAHQHLLVKVTVRDASGMSATRRLMLISYSITGRSPRRSGVPASASVLRTVGTTEFVSNGWTGGILAGCFAAAPCPTKFKIVAGGRTIATSTPSSLGADELGYLLFSLTAQGHALLRQAPGNQLPATLKITSGASTATAQIVLASFR
jgi:Domain of unknown function (DUF1906)